HRRDARRREGVLREPARGTGRREDARRRDDRSVRPTQPAVAMTAKTAVLAALLFYGAVFAMITVGAGLLVAFAENPANRWWISGTATSAGWLFAGIAFGPARWAMTAVPSASLGMFAFAYLKDRPFDGQGSVLLVAAVLAAALHLWNVRRQLVA